MTCLERAPSTVVGIDVSKDTLAVFDDGRQRLSAVKNSSTAVGKLIAGLTPGTLVIFEPTGGFETLLAAQLAAHGIACHRADTLKVKAFIKSFGRLAKTDAIDAQALAHYGMERWRQLALYQPADKTQAKLVALVARRQDLLAIKTAETNRSKAPGNPTISKSCKTVIACLGRQLQKIDREIEALIAVNQTLVRRAEIYRSLPGIGPRTAIALLATLPELGNLTRRQAASLAGLAGC